MKLPRDGEVDPEGDVRLVCNGKEASEPVKIRVSSRVLASVSPVFKAMLGPNFREGHSLASTSVLDLSLPDDDANAMFLLCHLLHNGAHEVPEKSPQWLIHGVALLTDKYACAAAIQPNVHNWMVQRAIKASTKTLRTLLVCAYWFDDGSAFKGTSKQLIKTSHGPLWDFQDSLDPGTPAEFDRLFHRLEYVRRTSMSTASEIIERNFCCDEYESRFEEPRCRDNCTYFEQRLYDVILQLRELELWPVSGYEHKQFDNVISTMKDLTLGQPTILVCGRCQRGCKCERNLMYNSENSTFATCIEGFIQTAAAQLEDTIVGVCLECFRQDKLYVQYKTPEIDFDRHPTV